MYRLERYEVSWNMTVNKFFCARYARQIGSGRNNEFKPFCVEGERDRGANTEVERLRGELGDEVGVRGPVGIMVERPGEIGGETVAPGADRGVVDCVRNLGGTMPLGWGANTACGCVGAVGAVVEVRLGEVCSGLLGVGGLESEMRVGPFKISS